MISSEKQNIIVNYLKAYQPEMIGIFGSYSRGEERPDSDLDILINIKKPIGLLEFVKMGILLLRKKNNKEVIFDKKLFKKYFR